MHENEAFVRTALELEADGLTGLGVAAAAAAIRNGDISSESYTAALLQRARTHSDLNAFITIDETAALAAARNADKARAAGSNASLLGVPLAVKDSYLTKGLRTTLGVRNLEGFVPEEDAVVVGAIKDAGGVVFGKNNLVEMSYGLTGNNEPYGQVKNPHERNHVTGGSSSGGGASVAARIVPAALGGDTVGSIRVPASLCGVVGFKPTTGRWPGNGVAPISHTLDTTGVLARNVEDCALIDQIVTKAEATGRSDRSDLKGVRLAYAPRQYLDLVDPEIEVHFNETVRRLRETGAEIVAIDLGEDFSSITERATWNIFFHETMEAISGFLHHNRVPTSFDAIYDGLKPGLREAWGNVVLPSGPGYSRETYEAALSLDRPEIQRRFSEAFTRSGAVALLFPTTPCTAPLIEHQSRFSIADQEVSDLVLAKNTIAASAAGLPGISIPTGLSRNGLPIGLEIDGAHGRDRSLLELARLVEAAVGALPSPV
ncbi:Indoleacetamide hydrolase (plasmid) [Sinorhizobium fredii NGR234]|uniref:Indoleacetamide hydrolase n=1 Tax=Sinorhizobium fredii (strain NBRC 101917 / NGR234) TaxID=394 RepID=Q6W177_SINFN|nr:amidase family protein [Sinorhizobium fredii]AAQ87491.1 Indoleacetamide hydrolase [Sinorhizobium fredii NGR234]ACP22029.1 Indoleacetamide hydrolase [Sinorhizobium fredii NGR234]